MSRKNTAVDEEEIIYVSKSELKRDAQEIHELGAAIALLGKKQQAKLPLNDDLVEAMVVADKIDKKNEAYRRHLNYIAKTLRQSDNLEDIQAAFDLITNKNNKADVAIHGIEHTRTELIEQGDKKINELVAEYANFERQRLRQLTRQAKKELDKQKPGKSHKELFQYLKDVILG